MIGFETWGQEYLFQCPGYQLDIWVVDRITCINPLTDKKISPTLQFWPYQAIHNFKRLKIWQNGGQQFCNLVNWCHILSLKCSKAVF